MSFHSARSPSKSWMWLLCHGAMAMPENQKPGGSSKFADEGTAAHTLASECLLTPCDTTNHIGHVEWVNGNSFTVDEDMAANVQVYLDEVRRQAMGGVLLVEQRVALGEYCGTEPCPACLGSGIGNGEKEGDCKVCKSTGEVPQGGTSDAIVIRPEAQEFIVTDLKFGRGEIVWASYTNAAGVKRPNPQLALYALGALPLALMFGPMDMVKLGISQPRVNHSDEFEMTVAELLEFGGEVKRAVKENDAALICGPQDLLFYLTPGDKQCRWCQAKGNCPKLAAKVMEEVRSDFDEIQIAPLHVPAGTQQLSKAYDALDLISSWSTAVRSEMYRRVNAGELIDGPDGKPRKFVQGKDGNRAWDDEAVAEGMLVAQLGPEKAYAPRKILTAAAAAKILDRKATKNIWTDGFVPIIKRAAGRPILVLGSDTRPAYSGAADASDFEDELGAE